MDWRKLLIYTHRWLGIAGSVVFLVWFASGVVMMYVRMPRLTAEERLSRLEPVDVGSLRYEPVQAAQAAGVFPERLRVGMLHGRPVYRFLQEGAWTTVYADSGRAVRRLSNEEAVAIVREQFPEVPAPQHAGRITDPDQWTLDGGLPRFLPMHRVSFDDAAGTTVYVSEKTAEVVMKTTAHGRAWGYAGAVLHWTYFTPLREQRELWRYSIIYAALIGCVMCLSGLIVGIWRFSPSGRYRLKRQPSHSPYAGWMWWHHYAGLLFGLFTFTWALSGALSLTPWDWAPSTSPDPAQVDAATGGPLQVTDVTIERLRQASRTLGTAFQPRELEVQQFRGAPYVMAYRPPTAGEVAAANSPDVRAIYSAQLALDQRAVVLREPDRLLATGFPRETLEQVAREAMPNSPILEATWLDQYDAYYYDKWHQRPLPVLRVKYGDPTATWLYLDAQHGTIPLRLERLSRLNRWLYNGLHSFDLPGLYFSRPAWDILLILLSAGGLALTVTTMIPAIRRLRRHVRRLSS